MQNEIEMIDTEDIFDEMARCGKVPVQKSKDRRKRSEKNLFAEIKVKMVMRIYGVSRARALEIIAKRANETSAAEGEGADRSTAEGRDGEFMSAREFFGE